MLTREFTLQPALSYKTRLEEMRQMELAEIEIAFQQECHVLEALSQIEQAGYRELEQQHLTGQLNMDAIALYLFDLQTLQRRIEQQLTLLEDLSRRIGEKRGELIEASKEKKALEKLKGKYQKEIAQARAMTENKTMEDMATSQFHRRKMGH